MFDDMSLADLFAEADAIGNKYQDEEERLDHLEKMWESCYMVPGLEESAEYSRSQLDKAKG